METQTRLARGAESLAIRAVVALAAALVCAETVRAQVFLSNGVASNFTLPSVTSPTLFTGAHRISVPEGATSLLIELTTSGNADLDLFVRYGTDVTLVNGQPVIDYSSQRIGTGNETINVTSSSTPPFRVGTYFIAYAAFTFGQPITATIKATYSTAPPCTYSIAPTAVTVPVAGSSGTVTMTAGSGCTWTTTSNATWLSISPSSGSGNGTLNWTAQANTTTASRNATVTAGGRSVTFTQAGVSNLPQLTSAGVTNGASFQAGLTPGSIVTLFGSRLSGANGVVAATALPLPTTLSGASVTVNGVPAPLFAVANVGGSEQINLQVPWQVTEAQQTASIVVTNAGQASAPVQVPILGSHPGLFTVGGGAAAVLHGATNQLVTAANPAERGEVVVLYGTGMGPVSSPPASGQAASGSPLSLTSSAPVVTVGGFVATVHFSGLAPGFVGLYQINLQIPEGVPAGNAALQVLIGGRVSQTGVTIAVR